MQSSIGDKGCIVRRKRKTVEKGDMMDFRIQRTRKCIVDAFLKIRAKKELEKISVKEIAETALINKATFYNHFESVFDLSDKIENEVIDKVLSDIEPSEWGTGEGTRHIAVEMQKIKDLLMILFSGTHYGHFSQKLEKRIKEEIYSCYPQYRENPEKDVILTTMIYGGFYATNKYEGEEFERAIDTIARINDYLIKEMF